MNNTIQNKIKDLRYVPKDLLSQIISELNKSPNSPRRAKLNQLKKYKGQLGFHLRLFIADNFNKLDHLFEEKKKKTIKKKSSTDAMSRSVQGGRFSPR